VRSGLHTTPADAILGHRDNKESLHSRPMTMSDDDLIKTIYLMKFDIEETERWANK